MNCKNSKTSNPHRLLKRKDKYIGSSNLSIDYT